jgi:hypothetical protein
MEHLPVKVQIGYLKVADLKTAETAAVEQAYKDAVLEKLGGFEQPSDLFLAQYYRESLIALNGRQLNTLIFKPLHTVDKAQGIDGEFKIGIRRGVVLMFDQIEIIVDLLGIDISRQFVEMQGQLCQVVGIIAQGAFTSACHGDFLAELLVKFTETCYIRTGCFDKVCFFFMIEMS